MSAAVMLVMALLPGIPMIPFLALGGGTAGLAYVIDRRRKKSAAADDAKKAETEKTAPAEEPMSATLKMDDLKIELGYALLPLVNATGSGDRLTEQIKALRRSLAAEMGFVMPSVRILDNVQLDANSYVIKIKEVDPGNGKVWYGQFMVMDPTGKQVTLPGVRTTEPTFGLPATWIEASLKEEASVKGYTVVNSATVPRPASFSSIRHPEGCMKALYTATILLATATAATFQSLDQTFDEISSKLQAAQQTLSPPPPGTKVQMPSDVVIYSRPDASASTPLKLEAQTPVTFQGTENGFVKLTTQNVPQPFYVKDGKFTDLLTSGVGSAVNDKLKSAVHAEGTGKRLARESLCSFEGIFLGRFNIQLPMNAKRSRIPPRPQAPAGLAPTVSRRAPWTNRQAQ